MLQLLHRRVPFYFTLVAALLVAMTSYCFSKGATSQTIQQSEPTTATYTPEIPSVKRLEGYSYIAPLMFVDWQNKSAKYTMLADKVTAYIEAQKQSGEVIDASFYFQDMENTQWTGYQENNKYLPGSLLKVPTLITYLHIAETEPGILNKQYYLAAPLDTLHHTHYITHPLAIRKTYMVKELLHSMISYSDNNAATLLNSRLPVKEYNKTLRAFELPELKQNGGLIYFSPKEYSYFLRGIYNASYLTIPYSEYAARLLGKAEFKEGFAAGLPKEIKMMHKFGESGTDDEPQLNESAIIYINNRAYSLTVMTKGTDMGKLASTLSNIASIMYREISAI